MNGNRKIRVGLVTTSIDNRPARGTARVARRLLEHLSTYQNEFNFTLIHTQQTSDPIYQRWPELFIPQIPFPIARTMLSEALFWLKQRWQGKSFDIIHYLHPRLWPSYLLTPAKKIVVTAYDAGIMLNLHQLTLGEHIFRFTNCYLNWRMHAVVAVSNYARDEIIEYYKINPNRVYVAPAGADEYFKPLIVNRQLIKELEETYNIRHPFILSVGRLDPHKNILRLLDAYILLQQRGVTEHHLVLVGGKHLPEYSKLVDAKIKSNNLTDVVHCPAFVKEPDLPKIYSAATALIYPSLHEGFGLPIIEAMACGTPVIASNTTSLPEVAGDAALLVNPESVDEIASSILRLLRNKRLREELIHKGLERAKFFTWEEHAEAIVNIYRKLAAMT